MSKLKAIGCFIFGGSSTFGTENAGYKIDRVLEMTDDMKEKNAYHFVQNRPDIPIVLPDKWDDEEYLKSLKQENYDLLYSNCPCSGLSQINRNASVNSDINKHFYKVFDNINVVEPKTFVIENAPALIKKGYPVIKDMVKQLGDKYKFTIIRDYAGNHDITMKRMRTLLVGWKNNLFDQKIPLLKMNLKKQATVEDVIGDLYDYEINTDKILNHTIVPDKNWEEESHLYKHIEEGTTLEMTIINNWDKLSKKIKNEKLYNKVLKNKKKVDNGKRFWNKSPYRVPKNKHCPSMTSITNNVHPIHNRMFTIREYARLMGYPDDFEFFPEECGVPIVQSIAQGVPANFIEYITTEIKEALNGNREIIDGSEDNPFVFQHHTHQVWRQYTNNEINKVDKLEHDKSLGFNELTE
jgi:DNA (cytosine-5)-methyltransferase 1